MQVGPQSYSSCFKCHSHPDHVIDELGFGIYALQGDQAATDMHGYKSDPPARRAVGVVKALTYRAIEHAVGLTAESFNTIMTVPSLRGRVGKHALADITEAALRELNLHSVWSEDLRGTVIEDSSVRRRVNATGFSFVGEKPPGRVLLIDDTWVSGGHMVSAASTLRHAGATHVTAVALCRWLDKNAKYTGQSLYQQAERRSPRFESFNFFTGAGTQAGLF
jgi:predicted amidophosphoribosyltransferase